MTRSPVNRRDPSGTRRIERREIARMSRIIDTYAEAMARVASGVEEGVSVSPDWYDRRDKKLGYLRDAMKEDLLAETDGWLIDTEQAAIRTTDKVLTNLHTGIKLGNITAPREELSILRLGIEQNVTTVADDLLKNVARITAEGYQEGLGAEAIARNIRDAGLTSKKNAERMVRTETMRVCDVVSKNRYTAAGCDGYMSFPTDDDRLCPHCLRMATGGSGRTLKVYGLDEPMALPWHPNCRCTRLPHFADDKEAITI